MISLAIHIFSIGGVSLILETERLYLRKLNKDDFSNLCSILQDAQVMYAYEHAFSDDEVSEWLCRQLSRYEKDGFGLWAVILKETSEFIGQCGITMQDCNGTEVPEIGYLFRKAFWHCGYATEAAIACREYAFHVLGFEAVYSIIRDSNEASKKVARKNGMHKTGTLLKHYYGIDMPHDVYCVRRNEMYP
ncbi:GNAT family N-acetyltransferase [Christensenella hongkongensis]|uniref:GNAT family N-acetyltransferase n=1 Tax=Christensenella hongkongensis TaxID=270498 RepID=UPI0039C9D491